MILKPSFINVPSQLSNVEVLMTWLNENLFKFIEDKKKISILSLVVQEAIINAIKHGNKENIEKKVSLGFEFISSDLHIKIEDEGEGIPDINKNKENINDEDLLKESGRGIILMKHLCKNVIFNKRSVELVMEI